MNSQKQYKNPKSRREAKRLAKRRAENIAIASALANEIGCELTGQKLPMSDLNWHHPEKGKIKLSKVSQKSRSRFLHEIADCILVSSAIHVNWHRMSKITTGRNDA